MNKSIQTIKPSSTRVEHIWYYICIVGVFCLGYATYHILLQSDILGTQYIQIVHTIWQVLWHILGIFLVSNTVSLIFREIKYNFAQVHTLVRKFLPLLRFISLSLVWIVGTLILVKSFDIDITTVLTGAGIGGIIFALASRDIFSNIFGNISILMSKMFDI
jgi:small-conductance mechanosensitive channel